MGKIQKVQRSFITKFHKIMNLVSICCCLYTYQGVVNIQFSMTFGQVIVDKEYQQEIEALKVNCSFYNKGCTWSGQLKDVQVRFCSFPKFTIKRLSVVCYSYLGWSIICRLYLDWSAICLFFI